MLEVQVKYDDGVNDLCFVGGSKSNWVDLAASEEVVFEVGDYKLVPLGVCIKLPDGYEAIIVPRSSTFKNFGLLQVNSIGIMDNAYCGDNDKWYFPAYATRKVVVHKGDRLCQFRLLPVQGDISFTAVDHLGSVDRGGFGTTGIS